ncbi:3-deoxy-manno-octulosonate cytidylyltransferase [Rhodoblastus acidophilus]|jgi:3-deoxy-manno-octulosonate cytidylyltransferase (CMP-KDO synthetase)|uniref:3-deoxy-manno-octulosonate cytidylyltransferase n=1 Tax=Rhodoblastus acidophilus TaxID=1074 RepID=A0A6N8DN17_RHOAC|nr:3-deoxy-manno-octulosonate cytidylyltransferase [Rhodoblastus acidophilus]MCW2273270.1 3-deoxy-manno-octulosonate cytidylyltransferase (CMP-KDO synthetase) [Rhodoblastus acidophilus]MTV30164.1 3-deoxy-manno-octulosonate cytidylyltransferase [Rhodoblastus acidophilus]
MPHPALIVIPARLASTRLPDKPLADICGAPMIVQVFRRAVEAEIGPVLVAADGEEIARVVRAAGGEAVVTDPDLPSGSDRIAAALRLYDPDGQYGVIVNLQGDLPTIDPASVRASLAPLADAKVDIATLAARILREEERTDANVVKLVGAPLGPTRQRALYFTRATAPWGEGDLFHHIGLYAYRRAALEKFVALPPSALEKREKLEQLRALEAGMRIDVEIVDAVPLGVDAPHDLERARAILKDFSK